MKARGFDSNLEILTFSMAAHSEFTLYNSSNNKLLNIDYLSCPFDYVTIYDGPDTDSPKIGTYCGQMRNLVIFSTKNMLYMTFTTLKRSAPAQNRGFFGLFEFSESYVNLGMLQIICNTFFDPEIVTYLFCSLSLLTSNLRNIF